MATPETIGRKLQVATIGWNIAEVFVTIWLGIAAGSLALVAFGLDSLVEVFASFVVLWHMAGRDIDGARDRKANQLVGLSFALLAIYLIIASARALWLQTVPDDSLPGIVYLALTAVVMFGLAAWKRRIGKVLDSEPFLAEARMTLLDGWLATSILVALAANVVLGWWWADALAAAIVSVVSARESAELLGIGKANGPNMTELSASGSETG